MKKSIMPLTVGLLAALLILIDAFLAPLFHDSGSFVWVAFVSWTAFFTASVKERLNAIPGYIIGFLSANLIVCLSGCLGTIPALLASIIAVFVINALVMSLAPIKFLSIAGIFIGIAMTFSRAGVGLEMWNLSLLMLIIAYGILGLLCGYVCTKTQKELLTEK